MEVQTIKKRDGRVVPFDSSRIVNAMKKAYADVGEPVPFQLSAQVPLIMGAAKAKTKRSEPISVESIQDAVEERLVAGGNWEVARSYVRYRYKRELARNSRDSLDALMLEIADSANDEVLRENANKNPRELATQRDYFAGELSRDLCNRVLMPRDVVEANNSGLIHEHDLDYAIQHEHNCFSADTKFVTERGLMSFADFKDGDRIRVLSLDGQFHSATVHCYGKQKLYKYTMYAYKTCNPHTVTATENHRWILRDGTETTALAVGDKLVRPPHIYEQDIDWTSLSDSEKLLWCKGFAVGDGSVYGRNRNMTKVRLCGSRKNGYLNRFMDAGCDILSDVKDGSGDRCVSIKDYHKEIPEFESVFQVYCFMNGLYCADGAFNSGGMSLQSSSEEVISFVQRYADVCGLYITRTCDLTGQATNFTDSRPYTMNFGFTPYFKRSYTVTEKEYVCEDFVWCLEVEDTHNFILQYGIPTGNCCVWDLRSILNEGTVINKTLIEKPHGFLTACTIATQCDLVVASSQYGGQTFSIAHLVPFVDVSRQRYRKEVREELLGTDWHYEVSPEELEKEVNRIAERRVRREVKSGVQTIHYQLNTVQSANGQTPFVTLFMALTEAAPGQERDDAAMVFAEILEQRLQGTKNEVGVWTTPAFPKLVYELTHLCLEPDEPYYWLTRLAARCTARRMVPDYLSGKKVYEWKYGGKLEPIRERIKKWGDESIWGLNPFKRLSDEQMWLLDRYASDEVGMLYYKREYSLSQEDREECERIMREYDIPRDRVIPPVIPPMGCRSFLSSSPTYKVYGRWNKGVCTVSLPYVALLAVEKTEGKTYDERIKAFWDCMESASEIVHHGLQFKIERLRGTVSDIAPLLWKYGALSRLNSGEKIDSMITGGYSTTSFGYAGLYECVYALTGKSHTDPASKPLALEIMRFMNDKCDEWNSEENVGYSVYGTPIESTTYKFARALQRRFANLHTSEADEIKRYDYITNSAHVVVREKIDPFTKLTFEADFQRLCTAGSVNYIECAHMEDNIPAVLSVIKHIFDTTMYGELNTKSDFCMECGWDKEIPAVFNNESGHYEWVCPNCGNKNPLRMSIVRRVCGYLSSNDFNDGRIGEIKDRVVHLGGELDTDTPTVVAIPAMAATC